MPYVPLARTSGCSSKRLRNDSTPIGSSSCTVTMKSEPTKTSTSLKVTVSESSR